MQYHLHGTGALMKWTYASDGSWMADNFQLLYKFKFTLFLGLSVYLID